ncbi:hypothetical protein LK10_17280 [Sinomonas humi]|uniref:Uncharacterized protein n=1 Tax=Sinomonas humi TaxID=1338436 RepID=A0A0B2AC50_9MICC|nr:hypothetical protein LK10_17280 [Sinomonas humi]
MFSKYRRNAAIATALFCLTSVALDSFLGAASRRGDDLGWILLLAAAVALLLLLVLILRPVSARLGAVSAIVVGLCGVISASSSKLELPASLPLWAWVALAFVMATLGLLEDAEITQSKPKNRL